MESEGETSDDHQPRSDISSIERKRFEGLCIDKENAAKETPVSSSSSSLESRTNQDPVQETEGEETEARDVAGEEKNRMLSAESAIFADIKENPNMLQTENNKNSHGPESLRGRKQEAIKLGVELSSLVGEAMYLSESRVLNFSVKSFRRFLKVVNGPLGVKGIVVFYLTHVYKSLKMQLPFHRPRLIFEEPQFVEFLKLFSDAISLLEEVIRCIRNLSRTKILEDEPERLSALDSAIQDCKRQLRKIDAAITLMKQLCFKGLCSNEEIRLLRWIKNPEGSFNHIWNCLFQSEVERERQGRPEAEDEDTASQPSIH